MPQGADQCPHQGRLAGPQVAFEVDDQPSGKARRQQGAEALCRGLVGQAINGGTIETMHGQDSTVNYTALREEIRAAGRKLGFAAIGIARAEPGPAVDRLRAWLAESCHGAMDYMARHAELRAQPQQLHPGTLTVISAALDYLPPGRSTPEPGQAAISRYAQGRDYHKVVRGRLQKLADAITTLAGTFGYRVFSDSAPVMEVEFARQAGLGWRGKHALLLSRQGSWRFLGEIYSDLPLPPDRPIAEHCGHCSACLTACPTGAIVAPYRVDARRCISYLTIELAGAIPAALRPLIGNRIYGCDDCQTCCPWNRFAAIGDPEFAPRHGLDVATLVDLFAWDAEQFAQRLAGNPIRRIGFERWLRNIAVALGNGPASAAATAALCARADHPSALIREHVAWARRRLLERDVNQYLPSLAGNK